MCWAALGFSLRHLDCLRRRSGSPGLSELKITKINVIMKSILFTIDAFLRFLTIPEAKNH